MASTLPNSSTSPLKFISEEEIRAALSWDKIVPAISDVLVSVSADSELTNTNSDTSNTGNNTKREDNIGDIKQCDIVQPLRARLHDEITGGTILAMPGLVRPCNALATKVLSMFPNNSSKGLPTHAAWVILFDVGTGIPLALLEGNSITEIRTASASAAATLAVKKHGHITDDPVVTILGAGSQGAAHARVLSHVLKPKQVRIWSLNGCEKLVATLRSEGVPAASFSTVQAAVEGASVINTCTLAKTPILMHDWVTPGAHINSVGAAVKNHQEMESILVTSSLVFADCADAALKEAGDIVISGAKITGHIGEVIQGKIVLPKGRTTIFKSVGLAAEDAVAAKLVYDSLMQQ